MMKQKQKNKSGEIKCVKCKGKGTIKKETCSLCKGTGKVELYYLVDVPSTRLNTNNPIINS